LGWFDVRRRRDGNLGGHGFSSCCDVLHGKLRAGEMPRTIYSLPLKFLPSEVVHGEEWVETPCWIGGITIRIAYREIIQVRL
jgi:hypothetical protein